MVPSQAIVRFQIVLLQPIHFKFHSKASVDKVTLTLTFILTCYNDTIQLIIGLPGPKRADPGHTPFLINISHCHSAYQILEI